ncbi:MAG: ATP-binding protein [Sandaracinaceae bacterium]
MKRPTRISLLVRMSATVLAAGLLTLLTTTVVAVSLIRDDKEAGLVDGAMSTAQTRQDALRHRLALARAQLRAAAFAGQAGQFLEVAETVEGTTEAILVVRDGQEIFEAATDPEAIALLRSQADLHREGVVLVGTRALLTESVGDSHVSGVVPLADLARVPTGWFAELVARPGAERPGLLATREGETLRVWAPIETGLQLRIDAPLAPARAAAFAISSRLSLNSAIAVVPLIFLAWLLSRHVTGPLRALARVVRESRGGPLVLPVMGNDEVGDLAAAVQSMSERLHRDAEGWTQALMLHRSTVHSEAAYLEALESSLRQIGEGWEVLPASSEGYAKTVDRLWIPISGREDYGGVLPPKGVEEADLQIGELLVHTARSRLDEVSLERQAVVGEKLAMLSRLSASVAHEMNTPLAFVKANLLALEDEVEGGDATEMLDDAKLGVDRLVRIVRDLSSVAVGGHTAPERVEVEEVLRAMARMAETRRPQGSVQVALQGEPFASVDRGRIEQVVLNLMNNALDAAGPGAVVEVGARAEGDRVVIEVADNGPGIPGDMQGKLFEAFHTSKGANGTGLGLYISRSFVEAHGGTLELACTGPEGTTFRIELPAAPPPTTPPSAPAPLSAPPLRILVIDDDAAVVRGMKRWLKTRAVVEGTTEAREALSWIRERDFDLVLCDMNMPSFTGMDLAAELERDVPELLSRLVIVTGATEDPPPGLHVAKKPLDPATINRWLDNIAAGAALA